MRLWLNLAWVEWRRSFFWSKSAKPDFFWLTILLALTLSLALLVYGSREGLLNRFMDVSLGYIQQAGIPIWVIAGVDEHGRVIDRELLEKIKAQKIDIYPSRLVEWDEISLPKTMDGKTPIWKAKHLPFKGWAVTPEDPLWKGNLSGHTENTVLPLEVILSKSLFEQYFHCAEYEKALEEAFEEKRLANFTKKQPTSNDKLYCLTDHLWLDVRTPQKRELLSFRIHWVEGRIPTMDELGFLFPMSTLYALRVAKYYPDVKYYPEGEGSEKAQRIKTLILWQLEDDQALRNNLVSCLFAEEESQGNQIALKRPLPLAWVAQCAERYDIPLQTSFDQFLEEPYLAIAESYEGHAFDYENDHLTLFCEASTPNCYPTQGFLFAWKRYIKNGYVVSNENQVTADMLAMIGGYYQAFVYVKERGTLFEQLKKIQTIARSPEDPPALSVHPTYNNALVRFHFIDKVMQLLDSKYTLFFLLFLGVLLFVQIGIVIQHREHDYGIFMAKGMTWGQLRWMVCLQIVLSFVIGLILTLGAILWVRAALGSELSLITKLYEANLQVGDLELLPLLWQEYSIVSVVILGIALVMAIGFLIWKQIRLGQEAAHFFK